MTLALIPLVGGEIRLNLELMGLKQKLGINFNPKAIYQDIPLFDGLMRIEEVLDWIMEVEQFFEFIEIPPRKQVKLVAYRIKGGASPWWDSVQIFCSMHLKKPIASWPEMR